MEKELSKLELKLMNILWDKEHAFVSEIIDELPTPKLANSTISTMMRILVTKEFVGFETFGKSNRYYPLISKSDYTRNFMKKTKENFFAGSFKSMMSFFASEEKLSDKEIDELIQILNDCKK
ncbi:BlaI family penicillinase repressor [Dysgonomonadaceae bacterium PH5-43]|nr:BlaI family penicillinase repressor [Dysgonomonadaceae bacterium PH5-43]